jgi:hypothetical protein
MTRPSVVAFPRTLRALSLRSLATVAALAAMPTLVTVARGGRNLDLALVAAALVGGAALAYSVDDDAASVVAPSPTTLGVRRATSIFAATLVVATSWAAVLAVGGTTVTISTQDIRNLGVDAVTAAGVGIAVAAWIARDRGEERTGLAGSATAIVLMLFITVLAMRYPWLPALGRAQNHDRWLWLAGVAWAGVWWTARDPAARPRWGPGV